MRVLPRPGGGLRHVADAVHARADHRHSGHRDQSHLSRPKAACSGLGSSGRSRSALGCRPGPDGGSPSTSRAGLCGTCQHVLEDLSVGQLGRLGILDPQKPQQEGNGRQTVELGPLLLQVPDLGLDLPAAIQQAAFHRALRGPQGGGNVLHRHFLVVVHTDDRPLVLGQSVDDLPDQPGDFRPV